MVPRDKRPEPEDLDGYERQHDYDPDYTLYRRERADWMFDYRRDEEEKRDRESKGRTPLYVDEEYADIVQGGRCGFDRETFNLDSVVRTIKARPQH